MDGRPPRLLLRVTRRASRFRAYRQVGGALTRRRPAWLFEFTNLSRMAAQQYPEEFIPLLELLTLDPPTAVVEIGTSRGGTFFMLCQVADERAQLATLDLQMPPTPVETFGRRHQRVHGIEGNSRDMGTRDLVHRTFAGGLDVLFIDGDHSYEGVAADFDAYHGLVRPGGHVVFHDVVPDSEERTGVRTAQWSGGVPTFWRELKDGDHGRWVTREFVRSWDQDGFGIGVASRPQG